MRHSSRRLARAVTQGTLLFLFGGAIAATATLSACGDPECEPQECLNGGKYQTCETCENSVCTVISKSTSGEKIDECTYPDASNDPSKKNECYNNVHGAAEAWCVMHAQS